MRTPGVTVISDIGIETTDKIMDMPKRINAKYITEDIKRALTNVS